MIRRTTPILLTLLLAGCQAPPDEQTDPAAATTALVTDPNPPADGFNAVGSDAQAIAIADSVVKYHGGRRAYDDTRYLRWNFFGVRDLTWDKEDQLVRIEVPEQDIIYLLDYSDGDDLTGAVRKQGVEMTNPDSLALYLQSANSIFINDSYWLVQPFKLKDSGVTLRYGGQANDPQNDRPSEVLELTFSGVGDTPGNRYRLFVDQENYRINTWQFFRDAASEEPTIETPYNGYAQYGDIYLSGDRGGRFQLGDITAPEDLDATVFTNF